jgi:hypothetical protein
MPRMIARGQDPYTWSTGSFQGDTRKASPGTSKRTRDNLDTTRLDQFLISHQVSSVPVRERAVLELMQNYTEVDGHYFSLN